jgi:hypothetical protein
MKTLLYTHRYPVDSVCAYPDKVKYPACKVLSKGETFLELNYSEVMFSRKLPDYASDTPHHEQ